MLHIDANCFYGEQWASFTLNGLEKSFEDIPKPCDSATVKYSHFLENLSLHNVLEEQVNHQSPESGIPVSQSNCSVDFNNYSNQVPDKEVTQDKIIEPPIETTQTTPSETQSNPDKPKWTLEKFNKIKRRVNIDITPKLCYSDGPMVRLLRDSNCSRYLEFRAVNRSLVHWEGEVIQAPCNREQVFNCRHLKVLEKRIMMKFVTWALQVDEESEEWSKWEDKGDDELYLYFKLTSGLVKLVRASLVVSSKAYVSAHDAVSAIKFYLKNVGIYGSMPFICPVYGSGELPQAFARFSAVFGSIYVLDIGVSDINFDDKDNFSGVTLQTGQKINGKYCIISPNYSSPSLELSKDNQIQVSHAVYLTDSSIKLTSKPEEQDDISVVHILPGYFDNDKAVTGYEYGPRSCLPSEEMYMIHLTTPAGPQNNPLADLENVCGRITENVNVLHKTFFTTHMSKEENKTNLMFENNIIRTSRPTFNIGYMDSIDEARAAFSLMYSEDEFLPTAPNPEDIKWPDEDENVEDVSQSNKQAGEGEDHSSEAPEKLKGETS